MGGPGGQRLAKVHKKGGLADGRVACLSSLNWNRNAATDNREVCLIVDGAAIVEPFRAAFERDWNDGGEFPPPGGGLGAFPAHSVYTPLSLLPALYTPLFSSRRCTALWRGVCEPGGARSVGLA